MMTREYFLAQSLEQVDQVSDLLHQQLHVTDRNFHVLSLDNAGLQQHHLHAANILQQRDLVRGAELGGLFGICVGLTLFCIAVFAMATIGVASPFKQLIALAAISLPVIVSCTIGAWLGSRKESHKISRFHNDLESGHHLIIVDARKDQMATIRQVLAAYPVIDAGEDDSIVYPFDQSVPPYPQAS